ncbi:MAG: hypothetical protein IJ833_08055 [Lachnospiraceae bacterium]|nr:hypothetical protein [Lachnospiraceae bacterium]
MNWLLSLCRREWDYWEKQLVRQLRMELICIGIVFVLFVMSGILTGRFSTYIASMPGAVLAFWGLPEGASGGNGLFYMRWILMPLHVWIAWEACNRSMKTIWREEEGGQIYALVNQWYDRYQIGVAKYAWIVISFILKYGIMFGVYTCLSMVAADSGRRMEALTDLLALFLKGILVMVLLITLSTCHAMLHKRKVWSVWADVLILGTLVLGNLYKVKDLLGLLMRQSGNDYTGLIRLLGWSEKLRGLAPLSWLNPFTVYSTRAQLGQVVFCLLVSIGAALIGMLGYRIRKFA